MIPLVVASERGAAQTTYVTAYVVLYDHVVARKLVSRMFWKVQP